MKKHEILAEANKIVAEYMKTGWLINFGDFSAGYQFRIDMVKDGEQPIRICVESGREYKHFIETLDLKVILIKDGWPDKDAMPIYCERYYELSSTWYTTDRDEAVAAQKVQYIRYCNRKTLDHPITPTAKFLEVIQRRRGFEDATLKKLSINRCDDNYSVTLKNRIGNVKATYTARLTKTR